MDIRICNVFNIEGYFRIKENNLRCKDDIKMKKKSISIISQHFYPDKLSGGKLIGELAFGLNKKGFDVSVVAGRRLYQDHMGTVLPKFEEINGISIYRVFNMLLDKGRIWGRLFNYMGFFVLAAIKVLTKRKIVNCDIIFCVSDPPILPLLGALLKNKHNKFVYLLYDLFPDIAVQIGAISSKSIMARLMRRLNNYVFNRADNIIVVGRDMQFYLEDTYGVNPSKINVITNWSQNLHIPQRELELSNTVFRLVYTGNMGRFHDFDTAIEAAQKLEGKIELIFVGEGEQKEHLILRVSELGLKNVTFYGYLEESEYMKVLGNADGFLVTLEKGLAGLAVPSKFYTYLAAGKPIIAVVDQHSEVALTINEENIGIVIQHNDADSFIKALLTMIGNPDLVKQMGANAQKAFDTKYEYSVVMSQYETIMSE